MATLKFLCFLILQVFLVANCEGLEVEFYKETCPNVEAIVKETTKHYISIAPTLAAPLLRMHFHDCFVRQKDAIPNQSLRGFQVIDLAKCFRERINGPTWPVPLGRRDGRVSILSEASKNLPTPFDNFTTLKTTFGALGLNVKDLVVLSGGHTIGMSHCFSFSSRLYNFSGKDYYTMTSKRRGLFVSDATLLTNTQTKDYVLSQLIPHGSTFFKDFGESMVKMGQIGVLTGKAGEIRKHCAFRN
ncbi:hypothetical protein R3W88_014631 [Solanum pinnatisectum]|uniref:Plant heme peroxidase family profile domain-containing protein n=1 Tax=Solanum pinnatisectum TaxID=50273 RepID=A0AAV9KTN5_9SOLN|nr:hypothetical protein R3W88_014631 [Solanum pinnatisectum]